MLLFDPSEKTKKASSQTHNSRSHNGFRIPELDGIRGIAILSVLIYHLFSYSMDKGSWTGAAHLLARLTGHGARGVDLFFVLSGFLITGILLDTRGDPHFFRNFYARRALRILPLYYSVLLVMFLAYPQSTKFVALSFFHLSNIAPILGIVMVNGALWSLAVEEHFYLCWPQAVRWLSLRGTAVTAGLICVAEPVIRGLSFHHVSSVFPYSWFRLDGLALGALIACAFRSKFYSIRNARIAAIGLAALAIVSEIAGTPFFIRDHNKLFGAIFEFPAANLLCAALVIWAAAMTGTKQVGILRAKPLWILGDLSYCLYLVHMIVMDAYDATIHALHLQAASSLTGVVIRAAIVIGASVVVAMMTRKLIEQPALSLKRYFNANAPARTKDSADAESIPAADIAPLLESQEL
jgi:peptidoglycan/LPS O-acetylase OafA/YrhL